MYKTYFTIWAIMFFALSGVIKGQQEKRIYIANDDHTDYFWTADDAAYKKAFVDMLDYYLDLADSTENEIPSHQSRWNCDGSFWLYTYEQNKTQAEFDRLIKRIKDGHISVPLNALVVCLGGAPAEAVIRGMYYPGKIEREYNVNFDLAVAQENQTIPYGLIGLWENAGAKYSWKGVCACDTRVTGLNNREHEIYWLKGPADSKILMKWNSLFGQNTGIGGYAECRFPAETVDFVSSNLLFKQRYPYNVIGAFGKGWDDFQTMTDEFVKVAKAKTDSTREVIVSNEEDFFEDFNSLYGNTIPEVTGSYGNEWDVYCASLAEVSARVKRSVEKLRSAEALASIVKLYYPIFNSGSDKEREQVWMDLGLYWEHNFGMVNRPLESKNKRIEWQNKLADEIENYVNSLFNDAKKLLGDFIKNDNGRERFFVFNPLSWKRTDFADFKYNGSLPVNVVDITSGKEVPSQYYIKNGTNYIRILASNVPSIGYKVYEIRNGEGSSFPDAADVAGQVIENSIYKIELADDGSIKSIYDKSLGKEFVKEYNGKYVNSIGGGASAFSVENIGAVSATLVASSSSPLQHNSSVTLFKDINRINIDNEILQNFSDTYTWNFSFNLGSSEIRHEEVGAVIKAKLISHGGNYAEKNARYDWLTLNHFVDLYDGTAGVTLSNADCYFMKLGNSNINYLDESTPFVSVLAGGKVGGLGVAGLPDQGGDSYFLQRFALQAHSNSNSSESMRFALEHQNPFVTGPISGGETLPSNTYSLLTINNPDIILWALKPPEDNHDNNLVLRVWNAGNASAKGDISFIPQSLSSAKKMSVIETPVEDYPVINNSLHLQMRENEFQTYGVNYSITDLPVTLLSFNYNVDKNNVKLSWSTASEENNSGFEINRNGDSIGFVKGKGNSIEKNDYIYVDSGLPDGSYTYRLRQHDFDGTIKTLGTVEVQVQNIPLKYMLMQNFPNPFNPRTIIRFGLPKNELVVIKIYNELGEEVRELVRKNFNSGYHEIQFDASQLASGIYFYTIFAGSYTETKKLILIN